MQFKYALIAVLSAVGATALSTGNAAEDAKYNCWCSPLNGNPCVGFNVGAGQACTDRCINEEMQLCG